MNYIKKIFEFSETIKSNLSIERNENSSNSGIVEFRWLLDGKDCGMMIVKTEGDYSTIVAYTRKIEDWIPRGVGYDFIKMCIDDILKTKKGVISTDYSRNKYSEEIINKLSGEYSVTNGMYKGSKAKLITNK